jgi:EAL domain-containing protein (putative c-di-GMP-specific phosphodiesterase class I)
MQPSCAGDLATRLAELTGDGSEGAITLIMLGEGGAPGEGTVLPPQGHVVVEPSRAAVASAISGTPGPNALGKAELGAADLHQALTDARLRTRYQPIVRLSDRTPWALEALARLDHAALGTLSPGSFVPQMEDAGLGARLTRTVVRRALGNFKRHFAPLGVGLTLNFPLDVLLHKITMHDLFKQRVATGIDASKITIELTESRPLSQLDREARTELLRELERLRAIGYGLAIDDVTMDMPDVRELLAMPFTAVKLDIALVAESLSDPRAARFLEEVIARAKRAGMEVVAEGVEDQATWDRMRAAGADCAQGFLVARPLPASAVPAWMDAWRAAAR